MGLFRRMYRVRPLAAALMCLPGIVLCGWYAWKAYGNFDRYRRVAGDEVELSADEFQLHLYDALQLDLRRITMGSPPEQSKLPQFQFQMSGDNMTKLLKGASLEQKRPYVAGKLERDGKIRKVQLRLRGQQHWHLIGKQKSLKVKLPKGKLLDGHRVFNLINDPTPMVVGEALILNLARKDDVLTPRSEFARVSINGADLGVFHYETQPDESLLRAHKRVPGSIYSGNLPGSAETEELWRDHARWRKVAARSEDEQERTDDIERLLKHISGATTEQFVDFARNEIDLEAVARFDALDVAFGGDQHDFRQNHKLYFDPYRGRWEPVAWNFRGFKHDPMFNLVENPLLLRLKQVPEFVSLRNRLLYELLEGRGSVAKVRRRGLKLLKKLAPELRTDPHWHAYKLLPRVTAFHRRMVRPMNMERAAIVFESELTTYARRHAYLMRQIEHNPLWIDVAPPRPSTIAALEPPDKDAEPQDEPAPSPPPAGYRTDLRLVVDGHAGVSLERVEVTWAAGCSRPRWQLLRAERKLTEVVQGSSITLERPWELYPTVGTIAREDANRKRGDVRTVMWPSAYAVTLESTCRPQRVQAWGAHLATGSRARSRPVTKELHDRLPDETLATDTVPRFTAGELGPHPGELERPAPEQLMLGPGLVRVEQTRVFGREQTVEIAAGTELQMAAGTSLIFLGPVHMRGTASDPIVIDKAGDAAWGGIALQGPATAGSSLRHVSMRGGTAPRWRLVPYPGMVNLHDTREIAIEGCRFGDNQGAHDLLHAAYVRKLRLRDTVFERAAEDALDLEFTRGELVHLQVLGAGDEALDLMGSKLVLRDSLLVGAGGNAISAGEETELTVHGSLIARSKVGVLAKNASSVELTGSLLHGNKTGLRIYQRTVRYAGASEIRSDALFVVGSDKTVKSDDESRDALQIRQLRSRLPRDGSLEHLLSDVLRLDGWDALDGSLTALTKGARP